MCGENAYCQKAILWPIEEQTTSRSSPFTKENGFGRDESWQELTMRLKHVAAPQEPNGFTLIELLVVIAIIAILQVKELRNEYLYGLDPGPNYLRLRWLSQ